LGSHWPFSFCQQALGAVAEPLRREFGLSDAQLGGLSTVFIVVYAVAGLPLGRLADTWSRRKLLAIGVAGNRWIAASGAIVKSNPAQQHRRGRHIPARHQMRQTAAAPR
jgi:MFS family permease